MHLYVLSRGIKHDVDRVINELSAKYMPMKLEGKDVLVQVAVRPIQLWEIVFPEEQLQSMLNTLEPMNWKRTSAKLTALRMALNAQKVPKADMKTPSLPIYRGNVELNLLGMKKDKYQDGMERL